MIRVLLVDDDALVRSGLRIMLAGAGSLEVVAEAADGREVLSAVDLHRPDVVLMDIRMPQVDGIAATRLLATQPHPPAVLVLTTFDADELVFDAIRAGAQAYLLKDAPEAEVLDTIRAVHRGESRLSPNIARKVMEQFRLLPARAGAAGPAPTKDDEPASLDALTAREERILALIAEGKSNKEIARTVFLAEGTVKNYVSRIMEKLHARTRTELAVKALRTK